MFRISGFLLAGSHFMSSERHIVIHSCVRSFRENRFLGRISSEK